jgi:HEAT repeat protein
VAILGEMGAEAEEAVSHITGTLANPDPRVRLESVRALGKLGGEDAEMLLVGMLNDQDPEVRAAACRSVGALKVEKALKPLLQLLEEDEDEDVRVGALQALGQIGDPGAVPVIEKRALGGLFSRPGRDVRIAAYRALAGIGTPKARNLLEKARSDRDREVRAVVEALLQED